MNQSIGLRKSWRWKRKKSIEEKLESEKEEFNNVLYFQKNMHQNLDIKERKKTTNGGRRKKHACEVKEVISYPAEN